MNETLKAKIQVFDPQQSFSVRERRLPHWSQAGTICFIIWRTWDSIPDQVLKSWLAERDIWLRCNGIDPNQTDCLTKLREVKQELLEEYQRRVSDRWNEHLDACHGACVLRRPELASAVADSLRHFDGERYDLIDFVVMPNHVHVLVAFPDEESLLKQCESWKHFTALKINRMLGRKGRFWQQDGFDHLVRSDRQFEYLRRYVAENPGKAGLRPGEYLHMSKDL